jgi:uncharacterized protein
VTALRRAFFFFLPLFAACAYALQPVPPLSRRVTDLTGTLSGSQQSDLEKKLADAEAKSGAQVAVLIVPTTKPEAIEPYAIRVAQEWKLGRKGVDDGVLFLIAKDDRALRFEVGYGLEGALPDAACKRIIDETVVPRFKGGDFSGGISSGVDLIVGRISGEPLPSPSRPLESGSAVPSYWKFIIMLAVFIFFLAVFLFPMYVFLKVISRLTSVGGGGFTSGSSFGSGSRFSSSSRSSSGGSRSFGGGGGSFGGGGASGRW